MTAQSGEQFDRRARLTIVRLDANTFFGLLPNAVVIDGGGEKGSRVQFKITRDLEKHPNNCEISVFGLAPDTRAALQSSRLSVQLDAGYDGDLTRLFRGDVVHVVGKREGAGWSTKLQLSDGGRAFAGATVNRSLVGPTTYGAIVNEAAKQFGLTVPESVRKSAALNKQIAGGVTLYGPAHRIMDSALTSHGLTWSFQDGELQILGPAQTRSDEAILVSQRTGMVGSPEFGNPKDDGKPPRLTVKKKLDSRIVPGVKIQVQSRAINGVFRVEKVVHTGDTRGETWESESEAVPL